MVLLAACTRAVSPVAAPVAALWVSLVCLLRRVALAPSRAALPALVLVQCLWLWVAHWCLVSAL